MIVKLYHIETGYLLPLDLSNDFDQLLLKATILYIADPKKKNVYEVWSVD